MIDILVVDDELSILRVLSEILKDEGYSVSVAENGKSALNIIKNNPPILILLDIWMPDLDGLEVLKKIKDTNPEIIVVMMSGHGTIETAIRSTRLGAYDFIEKPLSSDKVILTIKHAIEENRLKEENIILREKIEKQYRIIGESLCMKKLLDQIRTAGPTNSRVLISGENGTGKELVARTIHNYSHRASKSFVEINCAAIPDTLIESELFGYEKGSFTGAITAKKGKFELANGGTLFLDEIGDMSLATQARVLRILQDQRFNRIGGHKTIEVDVRIITASNKNLGEEIKKGNFREDLYYRLNVIPLNVPPLRERKEDIPLLINHFIKEITREEGIKPKDLTADAINLISNYEWPGNVRELKNVVERLVIMGVETIITSKEILQYIEGHIDHHYDLSDMMISPSFKEARRRFEKEFITQKLKENGWNISKTAEALKIERSNLHRKINILKIELKE